MLSVPITRNAAPLDIRFSNFGVKRLVFLPDADVYCQSYIWLRTGPRPAGNLAGGDAFQFARRKAPVRVNLRRKPQRGVRAFP